MRSPTYSHTILHMRENQKIAQGLDLSLLRALSSPHLCDSSKDGPPAHFPTTLCDGEDTTASGSSALSCLTKPERLDYWNGQAAWSLASCLVRGEKGCRKTSTTDLTTLQIYPRGTLSSMYSHERHNYPDSWNENSSLCVSPVLQLRATCRNRLSPLTCTALPAHISYLCQHTPLCPDPHLPHSPAPGLRHLQCNITQWLGAPAGPALPRLKSRLPHVLSHSARAKPSCVSPLKGGGC